ncbi:TOMM precursor leader peptide-binding protein [Myxococcus sp. K15C18031901]|uniref:TOMM precursor leader peptide-binding protein n=1 Tax=Myxococcus dinghuensis TaxID=2906761 RepID=UPI0020A6E5BC|nr:TOMM precursor leader peptide-binding protein [Myxococcus dinghuensis]MCP3097295.1 TOMM precursor leader peptide-binding protein [Myxococcus dinghuensis]
MGLLLGEREHYVVRGPAVAVLARLDGRRDVEQLIAACDDLPMEWVLDTLVQLEQRGLVAEVQAGEPARLAFVDGLRAPARLPPVDLVDAGVGAEVMATVAVAFRGAGFELAGEGTRVVVAADLTASLCVARAEDALRAGRAAFLVQPSGLRPLLGPLFTGALARPCPRCLSHALEEQRPVERWLLRDSPEGERLAPPTAALPSSVAAAAHLAAIELLRLMGLREPPARLWTLDLPRFELREHPVRHRPQCPGCGDPGLQAAMGARPVTLASVRVGASDDGGLRREPPGVSLTRLAQLVSPVLGPVTHLSPMPDRHGEGHPVFSSGFLVVPGSGPPSFDRRCAGKGCTPDQARMSALAEAIERTSGVYRGDEAARQARFEELAGEALHPDVLHLFSAAQQARGLAPPRLSPETLTTWTPAWSLTHDRRRWVPLAYCYGEAPDARGAGYCRPSSNGSAAGSCLEEAILQGLFELIERDAVAIWWYGRVRRPAVSVPESARVYFEQQRARHAARGWSMWALDLTHDLGLPVVVAITAQTAGERFAMGFGAHSDPALALRRAVSELAQVFDPHGTTPSPWDGMAASRLLHLQPDDGALPVAPVASVPSDDLKDHVMTWVRRLEARGLETVVVDKTRPDLGLCVAQVIVPGLRHPWPRLGPGRLYSVPVTLGWWSRPLAEDELHPDPLLV